MQIVIEIPDDKLTQTQSVLDISLDIISGTVFSADGYGFCILPKGHGRLIDISKIDEDKMDRDNPIIYLTVNGQYIEAVSLDYINDLPTVLEADKSGSEE